MGVSVSSFKVMSVGTTTHVVTGPTDTCGRKVSVCGLCGESSTVVAAAAGTSIAGSSFVSSSVASPLTTDAACCSV